MRVDNGPFGLAWGFSYLLEPVVIVGHYFINLLCYNAVALVDESTLAASQ